MVINSSNINDECLVNLLLFGNRKHTEIANSHTIIATIKCYILKDSMAHFFKLQKHFDFDYIYCWLILLIFAFLLIFYYGVFLHGCCLKNITAWKKNGHFSQEMLLFFKVKKKNHKAAILICSITMSCLMITAQISFMFWIW